MGDAFTRRWISKTIAGVARFQEQRRIVREVECDTAVDQARTAGVEAVDPESHVEHVTHEASLDSRLHRLHCLRDTIMSSLEKSIHGSFAQTWEKLEQVDANSDAQQTTPRDRLIMLDAHLDEVVTSCMLDLHELLQRELQENVAVWGVR